MCSVRRYFVHTVTCSVRLHFAHIFSYVFRNTLHLVHILAYVLRNTLLFAHTHTHTHLVMCAVPLVLIKNAVCIHVSNMIVRMLR
jgi:hypothetical protein